jgi:predicted TIM-barrel fold metal-dependent hydrolase
MLNDAHCHFFTMRFFAALGHGLSSVDPPAAAETAIRRLGWDAPGSAETLSDRWLAELDRHGVTRVALIASVPGDADAVAVAVARHRERFVGFFMVDPTAPDAAAETTRAIDRDGLRGICLFPAMHHCAIEDKRTRRIFDIAAARQGVAVFVHCGMLSVGARKKLGLSSPFDVRFGNPLDLQLIAQTHPKLPIIIPHFGAGLFREALIVGDLCPNVLFDTSSSNGWMKYHPGLTLPAVFRQALDVVGPDRLLFGSDSSFFPRGWVEEIYTQQAAALARLDVSADAKEQIFGGNFDRLFAAH